jgi:DNA invertase Pin-like site-specific DNA recombinase
MRPVTRTLSRLAQFARAAPSTPLQRQAAQYVRMSTDHQRYSIDNQSAVIAAYAIIHNFTIVRTYTDAGRSGLRVVGRDALIRLIEDVTSGGADFCTILVYDVSRWGRFQDSDEAAYYEFICRNAGVNVRYCAEEFENDGSLITTIVKGMKRAMAAEFSRELSYKVLEGQKRLAALGFHRGGPPPYGLRRLLIDDQGVPKLVLGFNQEKHLQTDRVILVPGPLNEIETVQEIFRMFVRLHMPPTHIARLMNEREIPNARGNRWTPTNVFKLLRNQNYVGTLAYNRTTQKLLSKQKPNPRSVPSGMWLEFGVARSSVT